MLDKILKDFLWSDGFGSKKRHCVKWDWCYLAKKLGGLGIKDIKTQGISLAAKWIFKAFWGNEPWKVLVRNNVERLVIKNSKQWDNIPFWDIIMGGFKMKVFGSKVFSSLWFAWTQLREFIAYRNVMGVLLTTLLLKLNLVETILE